MVPHGRLESVVGALVVVGGAEIADPAGLLPGAQRGHVDVEIDQIVHLHQVDPVGAKLAERRLHLGDTRLTAANLHLGGEEQARPEPERLSQGADAFLGPAVGRRRIHHLAPARSERTQTLARLVPRFAGRCDIERLIGAEANGGQGFSTRRNRAGRQRRP